MADPVHEVARHRGVGVGVISALAIGGLVLVLLVPTSGIDTEPPECYSAFGYVVPCGDGLAFGLALAAALVGGAVATHMVRNRKR